MFSLILGDLPIKEELVEGLAPLVAEIRALRQAVEANTAAMVPPGTAELAEGATECPHPEDQRVTFASPGNDDFHCKACGQMVHRPHAEVSQT